MDFPSSVFSVIYYRPFRAAAISNFFVSLRVRNSKVRLYLKRWLLWEIKDQIGNLIHYLLIYTEMTSIIPVNEDKVHPETKSE